MIESGLIGRKARMWLGLALLWVPALSGAEPADGQPEPPPPRYAVEILIFENRDQSRNTPEIPPPPPLYPGPGDPADGHYRSAPAPAVSFLLLDPRPGVPLFDALPDGQYLLADARNRLETLDAYRPVLHAGWVQEARARNRAQAGMLGVDTPPVPDLSGSIRLYQERYLHLVLDLELAGARIREARRLRSEQVQYFDHPRFGVLASVRELVPAEQPPEAPPR